MSDRTTAAREKVQRLQRHRKGIIARIVAGAALFIGLATILLRGGAVQSAQQGAVISPPDASTPAVTSPDAAEQLPQLPEPDRQSQQQPFIDTSDQGRLADSFIAGVGLQQAFIIQNTWSSGSFQKKNPQLFQTADTQQLASTPTTPTSTPQPESAVTPDDPEAAPVSRFEATVKEGDTLTQILQDGAEAVGARVTRETLYGMVTAFSGARNVDLIFPGQKVSVERVDTGFRVSLDDHTVFFTPDLQPTLNPAAANRTATATPGDTMIGLVKGSYLAIDGSRSLTDAEALALLAPLKQLGVDLDDLSEGDKLAVVPFVGGNSERLARIYLLRANGQSFSAITKLPERQPTLAPTQDAKPATEPQAGPVTHLPQQSLEQWIASYLAVAADVTVSMPQTLAAMQAQLLNDVDQRLTRTTPPSAGELKAIAEFLQFESSQWQAELTVAYAHGQGRSL